MKVYLQYPWRYSDSPYYKYLITNPPEGIKYLNTQQTGVITSKKKFFWMSKAKSFLRAILRLVKIPYITLTRKGNYDLIHCCHCLSLNKTPWVVDVEHYWNFASSGEISYSNIGKERIKKFLKNPYCKKILAWSYDCRKMIVKNMEDREITNKIEVVYPAIPLPELNKKKKRKEITLLFVARYFNLKGGNEVLKVFDSLCQKHTHIRCVIISNVPSKIKLKYQGHSQIKIFDLMPQKEVFKFMEQADIFVYPGYSDTFGFALIEAMSYGLPIVTVDGFAKKEIVGNCGIVAKDITEMITATDDLINLPYIRELMGSNARKEVAYGKFSMEHRNGQLKDIYEGCLE